MVNRLFLDCRPVTVDGSMHPLPGGSGDDQSSAAAYCAGRSDRRAVLGDADWLLIDTSHGGQEHGVSDRIGVLWSVVRCVVDTIDSAEDSSVVTERVEIRV